MLKLVTHLKSSLFAMTGYCHVERSVNIYTVILFYPQNLAKDMSSAMLVRDMWPMNTAQALAVEEQLKTLWDTCHSCLRRSKCLRSIGSSLL